MHDYNNVSSIMCSEHEIQTLDEFRQLSQKFSINRQRVRHHQNTIVTMQTAGVSESEWHTRLYRSNDTQTLVKALPHLHQGVLIELLAYHAHKWFSDSCLKGDHAFVVLQCRIVYFLLVALDPLMTASETAIIRDLWRSINGIPINVQNSSLIPALRVLQLLIIKHFNQQDLR